MSEMKCVVFKFELTCSEYLCIRASVDRIEIGIIEDYPEHAENYGYIQDTYR